VLGSKGEKSKETPFASARILIFLVIIASAPFHSADDVVDQITAS
jgi:hypothetical protein